MEVKGVWGLQYIRLTAQARAWCGCRVRESCPPWNGMLSCHFQVTTSPVVSEPVPPAWWSRSLCGNLADHRPKRSTLTPFTAARKAGAFSRTASTLHRPGGGASVQPRRCQCHQSWVRVRSGGSGAAGGAAPAEGRTAVGSMWDTPWPAHALGSGTQASGLGLCRWPPRAIGSSTQTRPCSWLGR